jgi:RNA-directed DNA polymerase
MDISLDSGLQQGVDDQTTPGSAEVMGTTHLGQGGDGGTRSPRRAEEQQSTAMHQTRALADDLMRQVVSDANVIRACKKVKANGGAPGIDGMPVEELGTWLKAHWATLRHSLLEGTYQPQPVRAVEIPKQNGGIRQLGIPTVVDRYVQQAMLQVLTPVLDPTFSASSYGFRPGKSAHQALLQAKEYVLEGRPYVVDIDLAQFFDRVNHDMLMARLARHVGDKTVLRIVRRFLQAGLMRSGVCVAREDGTPQGGPLSPILANLLLDDLDKELEQRGHCFCRYADDCNIYVQSQAAGERVMASLTHFLEKKLKLQVNQEKSAVALVDERKFLGYRLTSYG